MRFFQWESEADLLFCGEIGVIATPTDRVMTAASQRPDHHDIEMEGPNAEPEEPVKALETKGTFADLMVWGHETTPAADDAYVKGVQEWLQLAEAVGVRVFIVRNSRHSWLDWIDAYFDNKTVTIMDPYLIRSSSYISPPAATDLSLSFFLSSSLHPDRRNAAIRPCETGPRGADPPVPGGQVAQTRYERYH